MKAIIVGGGIGGLTAAIALELAGIEAHVFERATELREVGAGISLWANAIHSLDAIGVGDAIRARGLRGSRAEIRTWRGRVLSDVSYDELARRFGDALVMVHRADLLAVLAGKIDPARLRLNHECHGFVQEAEGVLARFTNGETARADLLIGADGLRSVVRSQLFGNAPPRYSGYTGWRAVLHPKQAVTATSESWGAGQRFGIAPLADGRVYWYATQSGPAGQHDSEGQSKQNLLRLFRGWHEPVESLIEGCANNAILGNDIYDREPLARWSEGRVTLLGDAAHPMTPNLGQGGCQAIEDGVLLAVCLRKSGSVAEGLRAYQDRRIPRTSGIVLASRRIGDFSQWENPLLRTLRDAAMWVTPRKVTIRQIESAIGYQLLTADERGLLAKPS
jgi:2-polyprenyl-6-methoxyphenol hydroxylase-like FAD-dependent oxidoreductase